MHGIFNGQISIVVFKMNNCKLYGFYVSGKNINVENLAKWMFNMSLVILARYHSQLLNATLVTGAICERNP